jgi:hypothetical protein
VTRAQKVNSELPIVFPCAVVIRTEVNSRSGGGPGVLVKTIRYDADPATGRSGCEKSGSSAAKPPIGAVSMVSSMRAAAAQRWILLKVGPRVGCMARLPICHDVLHLKPDLGLKVNTVAFGHTGYLDGKKKQGLEARRGNDRFGVARTTTPAIQRHRKLAASLA